MLKIRKAEIKDLEEITEIYNDAIVNSVATFDTKAKTVDEQKAWFNEHETKNPLLVADDGEIIGWASLSKYSSRCAYSETAELSIYVRKGWRGKGIGKELMREIVKEGKTAGLHAIISRITPRNELSIHLHESVGFYYVGIYKEVGLKFGKRLDVTLMQKVYKD